MLMRDPNPQGTFAETQADPNASPTDLLKYDENFGDIKWVVPPFHDQKASKDLGHAAARFSGTPAFADERLHSHVAAEIMVDYEEEPDWD